MKRWFACFTLALMLWTATANAEIELGTTEEMALPEGSPRAIYALEDGSFFLSGRFSSDNASEDEVLCMRVDPQGNLLWQIGIPTDGGSSWFMDRALLSDGSVVLVQEIEYGPEAGTKDKLLIVNAEGIVYQETIEAGDEQVIPQIHAARDGFFLCYGERRQRDSHRGTFHVPAIEYRSAQGGLVWKHVFEEYEVSVRGALPVEGGHILYGGTEEQKTGNRYGEGFLAKVDEAGNILWIQTSRPKNVRWRTYAGEGILLEDGGFVLAGELTMLSKDEEYPTSGLLAQFDPQGNLVWEETYKLCDTEFYDILSLKRVEEGYLMLGREVGYRLPTDVLLVDAHGKLLETVQKEWDKSLDVSWTLLDDSAGQLRIVARVAPDPVEEGQDVSSKLLVTPIEFR